MNDVTTRIAAALLSSVLLGAAPSAGAAGSVTLFAGYGGTSGIENVTTGSSADVKNAATFGAAFDWPLDPSRELQLYYTQQSTSVGPGGSAASFDLAMRTLHIGGTVFVDGSIARGFYAVGGLGVTQFSPSGSGYGSEVKPSGNLGFGYLLPLGDRLALRMEVRGTLALVNSSGGFLCSGGCVVVLKGDAVSQVQAQIGVTGRF